MVINKQHIEKFKNRLKLKSEPTQELYFIAIDKFLSAYRGDVSTNNVILFLNNISKNSIHAYYYALKFFFNSAEIPFSLKVSDIVPKGNIKRCKESMSDEEIEALIKTARLNLGTIEVGYIAVSTIYGARRTEIYNITHKDITEDISKLRIYALKGGDDRWHLIPANLVEVMKDFRYGLSRIKSKPRVNTLNMMFDAICHKALIELRPRLGFHSVRRALISNLLLTDLNATIIRYFCRWKPREQDIILNYDIKNSEKVDMMIFEKHPFLNFWI